MPAPLYEQRLSFAVPVTSGNYAPEEIIFGPATTGGRPEPLTGVTALLETIGLATGATLELWLLKVGGDSPTAADWFKSTKGLSAIGADTWPLAGYRGAKIRMKSGGTAGTAVVSATAD